MSLVDSGPLARAHCLRAAFQDPESGEGLAGFFLIANALYALYPKPK